jgi:uncharacterized protein (DUF697 family)
MAAAGLAPRDVLGLVRETRRAADTPVELIVTGVLAAELVRALRSDGEREVAHVGGDPGTATALLVVLGGAPTADDERAMRLATRAAVPIVAVQTDSRATSPLPYVTAESVVDCPPGQGFPVDGIARVLTRELGSDAVALAARSSRLREPIVRELVRRSSLRAAVAGALPWRKGAAFPVLTLIQARLVLDIAAAYGQTVDQERAPELAATAATGLGARALARRLPARLPLIGGVTGYVATRGLGEAAILRYSTGV